MKNRTSSHSNFWF